MSIAKKTSIDQVKDIAGKKVLIRFASLFVWLFSLFSFLFCALLFHHLFFLNFLPSSFFSSLILSVDFNVPLHKETGDITNSQRSAQHSDFSNFTPSLLPHSFSSLFLSLKESRQPSPPSNTVLIRVLISLPSLILFISLPGASAVVLMSHLGRPDGHVVSKLSLKVTSFTLPTSLSVFPCHFSSPTFSLYRLTSGRCRQVVRVTWKVSHLPSLCHW